MILEGNDNSQLIKTEESSTGSVPLVVYLRYFKAVGLWYSFFTVLFNILFQVLAVYSSTWLTKWADDTNSNQPYKRDMYLSVYGALGIGQSIFMLIGSIIFSIGSLRAARFLHNNLLHSILRFPMSFFDTTPLGRIINRFSKDMDVIDNTLPLSVRSWLLMFFNVASVFVVISISTPLFLVMIIPISILYYIIQKFYIATSRQLKRIESVTRSPIYSHFSETLTGQTTVRAYKEQNRLFKNI